MAQWGMARRLFAVDVLTMAFATTIGASAVAVAGRVPRWPEVVTTCVLIAVGLPLLAWVRMHLDLGVIRVTHDWALAPLIYFIYRAVLLVVGPSHAGHVYDAALITADRWLFGTDPTVWIQRFAFPALTETLVVAYSLFYTLALVVGAEFYLTGREARFRQWAFVCAFGFYLSYVGYLLLPAVGPRFTLHDFGATAQELPGLWLTPYLRAFVDGGGMVPSGVPNEVALQLTARDAFPSGHTMLTLVVIYWSWRHRLRVRWAVSLVGSLLIVGTVYLRYHYVVDVLAGAVLAGVVVAAAPAAHAWLARHLGTWDADLVAADRPPA